ncbi:hypothetical protein [Chryseobacterium culicis]|uniref:Uncharacterized protein n=2 Tax=Chryseobacterium TaxID=59732 RepID=A0A1H6H4M1_CHRCI|nr:hypothetical protein [Chryseobacterium culicis]MBE4948103.1 hypothetical protein [Chryseobacterium culicis]SEH30232.1 hypothetical protein SAMN05421593_1316 [Chryseobacterium culicis]
MIYIVQLIITLLVISFFIFSIIEIYCKIVKKESRTYFGMLISLILFFLMITVRNHLVKNELVKNIKASKIEQGNSFFSKNELSDIHIVSEKMRVVDKDIYIVLMPQKDTLYINQDFHDKNKFWVHYKKYEILKLTAPIGYIIKN